MPALLNVRDNAGRVVDATFSVERKNGTFVVNYESRGPDRNTEYAEGLELLLDRIGSYPAVIEDAFVTSKDTSELSELERRIHVDGYNWPLYPSYYDIREFRIAFGRAQGRIGRQPDAAGSGNPTRRVSFKLQLSGAKKRDQNSLEQHLVGPTDLKPQYWAVVTRPDVYRLADAIQALSTDWITTKGRLFRTGDGVVMWQAKSGGSQRGVVALAEVTGHPRHASDAENPFWTDRAAADSVEVRAPIRYMIPKGLPLWVGQPGNEFLRHLSVTRATGGTVFRITADQWTQILVAAGAAEGSVAVVSRSNSPALGSSSARGQGRGLALAERLAVENHAMARAKAYFSRLGYSVEDVSGTESHDLLCRQVGRDVYVEVKGTTSNGDSVKVTFNEVELAKRHHPNTAMFVTSEIQLDRAQDPPVATGGRDRVIEPWCPSPESLKPLVYECTLGTDYGLDVTGDVTVAVTASANGSTVVV